MNEFISAEMVKDLRIVSSFDHLKIHWMNKFISAELVKDFRLVLSFDHP